MSDVVLDASVVAKVIVQEPHSEAAAALIFDALEQRRRIIAPYVMPVEVTNVIRKRMRRDRLSLADATSRLTEMLALPITLLEPEELHERALALTAAHSLGAHDAHYVALAEMLEADLWVDDGRLLRAVRERLPFVRWIGDYR